MSKIGCLGSLSWPDNFLKPQTKQAPNDKAMSGMVVPEVNWKSTLRACDARVGA